MRRPSPVERARASVQECLPLDAGDFSNIDQENLTQAHSHLRFITLPPDMWSLPDFLDGEDPSDWVDPKFSMGYRHMISFFAIHVWEVAAAAGYEWVMRLDEDSFILSPIEYNLVEFMRSNNKQYGYRMDTHEAHAYAVGFPQLLRAFLAMSSREPTTLLRHCTPPDLDGLAQDWDHYSFYNNFFISNASFWRQPNVAELLQFIARSGGIYTHRWGDAPIHTAAVQIFMLEEQVHKFEDWT